jgi:hypothetical protein
VTHHPALLFLNKEDPLCSKLRDRQAEDMTCPVQRQDNSDLCPVTFLFSAAVQANPQSHTSRDCTELDKCILTFQGGTCVQEGSASTLMRVGAAPGGAPNHAALLCCSCPPCSRKCDDAQQSLDRTKQMFVPHSTAGCSNSSQHQALQHDAALQ